MPQRNTIVCLYRCCIQGRIWSKVRTRENESESRRKCAYFSVDELAVAVHLLFMKEQFITTTCTLK